MIQNDAGLPVEDPGTKPEADFWTAARHELREWFRRNAPPLGELYEGTLALLYDRRRMVPGWTRMVAHAIREIQNRLPDAIAGRTDTVYLNYKERLDGMVRDWERAGFPLDGSLPIAVYSPPDPDPNEVPLPRTIYESVAVLIRDHCDTRERPHETAIRLFEALVPEDQGRREALAPVINRWVRLTRWFVGRAHDQTQTDTEQDPDLFVRHFEEFEAILGGVVRDFFKTTDELDTILEETNR